MSALATAPDLSLPVHTRDAATPAVLGASGIAGLATAVAIPWDRAGAGWLVAGLAITAAVVIVQRHAWRGGVPSISRQLWVTGALAVLSVGAVRASEWLFVLCVLTAGAAGSLAVANGRSVRGVLLGMAAIPFASIRALPWAARGLAALRTRTSTSSIRLAGSAAVAGLLALVFGALFAGADAAFANLLDAAIPNVDDGSVARWILLFGVGGAITVGACFLLSAPPDLDSSTGRSGRVRLVEWMLPVGVLVLLFAAFVLVQLTVLFGGRDHLVRTTGLTAAEYARRGFWQLCVVTVLALLVIRATVRRAPVDTRADRLWLRVLLGGLAGLTLVIVASALTRMGAYQEAYGYTVLRVLVAACELWLGFVYLMVLAAIIRLRAGWLPRAVVGSAVLALLMLAVLNPDAYVAERNVARYEHTGKIDVAYLSTLSADAAPELARLPEPARSCALSPMKARLDALGPDGWPGFNVGRSTARKLLNGNDTYLRPCP